VVVAGGLGLAPLRSAVYHLLANRARYANVAVLYGGRSPDELLYVDELERWRDRPNVQVEVSTRPLTSAVAVVDLHRTRAVADRPTHGLSPGAGHARNRARKRRRLLAAPVRVAEPGFKTRLPPDNFLRQRPNARRDDGTSF
jgi:Oxidoreductase NAD-binding domain